MQIEIKQLSQNDFLMKMIVVSFIFKDIPLFCEARRKQLLSFKSSKRSCLPQYNFARVPHTSAVYSCDSP